MKTYRLAKLTISLSFLGALTIVGMIACRSDKPQTKEAEIFALVKNQAELLREGPQNQKQIAEDARKLIDLEKPFVTGTYSPIKVRGGSMTIRSLTQWTQFSPGPPPVYCTNVDVTKFYVHQPDGTTTPVITLTANWKVEVDGRDPSGTTKSLNGIYIQTQAGACGGSSSPQPVSLTAFGNSGFYPNRLDEDGQTHSKRFEDNTKDSTAQKGCQGPSNSLNGDEDMCERPFRVIVTPDTSQPALPAIPCVNGECSIHFEY